jgi:hypothetical protein
MVSENLTVTVNAITATAQAKLNRLRETVQSLGRASVGAAAGVRTYGEAVEGAGLKTLGAIPPTVVMGERVDNVGDEAFTSALQIGSLTSALSSLTPAASGASVSIGVLSASFSSLTAAVVVVTGALAVFGAVLASITAAIGGVIAGAGALAAAFTGIIGTGILAFGEQRGEQAEKRLSQINEKVKRLENLREEQGRLSEIQQKNLRQLKDRQDELEDETGILGGLSAAYDDLASELTPLITRFGEQFAPLIESAIDTLPRLVERSLEAAGGLRQLRDDVGALGRGFADALPGIVRGTVDLARQAIPVFQDFMRFVGENAPEAISLLVQTARENAPEFREFLTGFIDALPSIIAFGNFIIGVLIPALSRLAAKFSPVVEAMGALNKLAKKIPDRLFNLLETALIEVPLSGGPIGFTAQELADSGALNFDLGQTGTGGDPSDIGPPEPFEDRTGVGSQTIQIKGELVERDGEIRGVIDEQVRTNQRRGARRTARKNGEAKRRPR